jgi:hypothetical protein
MRDLHTYLTNPFDDPHISTDELVAFATDHLARLIANNPAAVFADRIASTTTALNNVGGSATDDQTKLALRKSKKQTKTAFRKALPAAIGKIHGAVESKFGADGAEMTECFPSGRTVFTNATDGDLGQELQTLVNGVTDYQAQLGAQVVTDATALLTGWTAVYQMSATSTGNKSTTQKAKNDARWALQLELFKNLLTLALNFPRQPETLETYMQQNLLSPHTPTPAAAAPAPTPPLPA